MGCKSADLIRSVWKRLVLFVQPLQFHDSQEDGANQKGQTEAPRRWNCIIAHPDCDAIAGI
jgi:hypothetical protein